MSVISHPLKDQPNPAKVLGNASTKGSRYDPVTTPKTGSSETKPNNEVPSVTDTAPPPNSSAALNSADAESGSVAINTLHTPFT